MKHLAASFKIWLYSTKLFAKLMQVMKKVMIVLKDRELSENI